MSALPKKPPEPLDRDAAALTPLVRLLARQAAREAVAQARARGAPSPHPLDRQPNEV